MGDREADFLSDLGEWEEERERCLACGGETDRLASDVDLDLVWERSLESLSAAAGALVCWRLGLGEEDRLRLDPERLIPGARWGDPDGDLEASRSVPWAFWFTLPSSFRAGTSCDAVPSCLGMMSGSTWLKLPSPWFPSILPSSPAGWAWSRPAEGDVTCTDPLVLPFFPAEGKTLFSVLSSCLAWGAWCVSAPRLPRGSSLDTASGAARGPLPSSASESEPDAELLSDAEWDGDLRSCFSSFFFFFFFFLAACLLCFLVLASPSDSVDRMEEGQMSRKVTRRLFLERLEGRHRSVLTCDAVLFAALLWPDLVCSPCGRC